MNNYRLIDETGIVRTCKTELGAHRIQQRMVDRKEGMRPIRIQQRVDGAWTAIHADTQWTLRGDPTIDIINLKFASVAQAQDWAAKRTQYQNLHVEIWSKSLTK